jgi:hypothetical protein
MFKYVVYNEATIMRLIFIAPWNLISTRIITLQLQTISRQLVNNLEHFLPLEHYITGMCIAYIKYWRIYCGERYVVYIIALLN